MYMYAAHDFIIHYKVEAFHSGREVNPLIKVYRLLCLTAYKYKVHAKGLSFTYYVYEIIS